MVVGVCGVYHDDGIYVITAKALAQGEGYRLINLPNSPLQTKYPILYPALLAIIWKIWPSFPKNLLLCKGYRFVPGSLGRTFLSLYGPLRLFHPWSGVCFWIALCHLDFIFIFLHRHIIRNHIYFFLNSRPMGY